MGEESNASVALAVLHVCPHCAGLGHEPRDGNWANPDAEMVVCHRCDGLGDLLQAIERRCYRAGREDALRQARYGLEQVGVMLAAPIPPGANL